MKKTGLSKLIHMAFKKEETFTLNDAYQAFEDTAEPTIRARIYEKLGIQFTRVAKGLYTTIDEENACVLMEGDGRDLSMLEDESIDCIITDHPWEDKKAHTGGARHFATYSCFKYTQEDFMEKARVLKDGAFLVEMIPAENESNYEYLYELKQMAKANGFLYYAKVSWKKGRFVSNTGRKAKNTQDLMIFSKGKARALRLDVKKTAATGVKTYMSGTNGMLPTMFDVQPVSKKERIHKSETPVALWEQLIDFVTKKGEIILDQFAGSGSLGEAALKTSRSCILKEISHDNIEKIKERLSRKFNVVCIE